MSRFYLIHTVDNWLITYILTILYKLLIAYYLLSFRLVFGIIIDYYQLDFISI